MMIYPKKSVKNVGLNGKGSAEKMSKWIDYDAINYRHDKLHDKSDEFLNGVVYMAQRIEEAPSIDLVRCKECVWNDGKGHCKLRYGSLGVFDDVSCDDYCSYGERKER